jgi:hypothetical protein
MSTLSIVIFALNGAIQAIKVAETFVTNQQVKAILDDVAKAIDGALGALMPHHKAEAQAAQQCASANAPDGSQAH